MKHSYLTHSEKQIYCFEHYFPNDTKDMIMTLLCYIPKIMIVEHRSDAHVNIGFNMNAVEILRLISHDAQDSFV